MTPDQEDLLEHIIDYLCEEQAEAVAGLSDAEIKKRALLAIRRAERYELDQPEAITAFASLMFLVAPDFDVQPNIAKALADTDVPAALRLTEIFQKTSEKDWDEAAEKSQGWDSLR